MKKKTLLLRGMIVSLTIFPLLFLRDFYQHIEYHFSGNLIDRVITSQWHIVVISIIFFLAFLVPLAYRRKVKWVEYSLISAFFVSLFVEMYGIPLTIFLTSKYMFDTDVAYPAALVEFEFLGVGFAMTMAMVYSIVVIVIGIVLIIVGWVTLYRNVKKSGLVSSGIYSVSRHPQYLGLILIVVGWLIGWPTILTLVFAPILVYKYITVCKKEELEMVKEVVGYEEYKKGVPFLL